MEMSIVSAAARVVSPPKGYALNSSHASRTPSMQRSVVSASFAPPEASTKRGTPPIAATSETLTATALYPTSSGEAHSLKCLPSTSMSAATTQRASPKRSTAQSSPMGTTTSGGGEGSLSERRRMTSSSFKAVVSYRASDEGPGTGGRG